MFFCKKIIYTNKNGFFLDKLYEKILDEINYNFTYRAKKENDCIIMKPINNLLMYNSFKPMIKILCTKESITLNIYSKKTSVFTVYFSVFFVAFLDLLTVIMKLYNIPDWLLFLLIAHICISIFTIGAYLSFIFFYKQIDNWFSTQVNGMQGTKKDQSAVSDGSMIEP